eukprot:1119874-Amorphochlora_amoeboformis.AAC.2
MRRGERVAREREGLGPWAGAAEARAIESRTVIMSKRGQPLQSTSFGGRGWRAFPVLTGTGGY